MKTCSVCKTEKPYEEYHKRAAMKDGHRSACKECELERRSGPYREKILKNAERNNRARGHVPLEEYRAKRRANAIPQSFFVAKRRAQKKKATPVWADQDYIKDLYRNAKEASEIFKVAFEVDHIVPLQGKDVCGLHCEYNLQILTADENRSKGNKHDVAGY